MKKKRVLHCVRHPLLGLILFYAFTSTARCSMGRHAL